MADQDERVGKAVLRCREELNRRTSGLAQAREEAEKSIHKYREEVERILQGSYHDVSRRRKRESPHESLEGLFEKSGIWNSISIANLLQASVIGLLIGLFLIYAKISYPEWKIGNRGYLCEKESLTTCKHTDKIINLLFNELSGRAGKTICENLHNDNQLMSKLAVETFLLSNVITSFVLTFLASIGALDLSKNPIVLRSSKEVAQKLDEVSYLYTDIASKPLMCRLEMVLWKGLTAIAILISGILLVLIGFYTINAYKNKTRLFNEQCFNMVDRIIEVLEAQKHQHNKDRRILPYVAISHLHDTLVPLSKRSTHNEIIWNKAREILSKMESRVRQESQLIDGEEYVVWRWLGPISRPGTDTEDH